MQAALPKSLAELLETCDASKKQQILRRMSMHMQPILEKSLLDPLITQRCGFEIDESLWLIAWMLQLGCRFLASLRITAFVIKVTFHTCICSHVDAAAQ